MIASVSCGRFSILACAPAVLPSILNPKCHSPSSGGDISAPTIAAARLSSMASTSGWAGSHRWMAEPTSMAVSQAGLRNAE